MIRTGTDADEKIGPAARSFAADAHDCIMVRTPPTYRIQVCSATHAGLAAMLYEVLHRDISNFEVRAVPKTSGLRTQTTLSLPSLSIWPAIAAK